MRPRLGKPALWGGGGAGGGAQGQWGDTTTRKGLGRKEHPCLENPGTKE